jgi:hypothetical protein
MQIACWLRKYSILKKKIPQIIIFEKSKGSVGITKAILMFIYYVLTAWGYN